MPAPGDETRPGWETGLGRQIVPSIAAFGNSAPVWLLGAVVALLGWTVGMHPPNVGLDASWNAGLAMASENGLQFGRDVVFSYGPLGFLRGQNIWFGDLAVLALLFYTETLAPAARIAVAVVVFAASAYGLVTMFRRKSGVAVKLR